MKIENENVKFVDLREVELGHVPSAFNILYEEFQQRTDELAKDKREILQFSIRDR